MSTTTPSIRCRARIPEECDYHGAQLRADRAFATGDIDAYLVAQIDIAHAIKHTPEVVDFFAEAAQISRAEETSDVVKRFNRHLANLKPDAKLTAAAARATAKHAKTTPKPIEDGPVALTPKEQLGLRSEDHKRDVLYGMMRDALNYGRFSEFKEEDLFKACNFVAKLTPQDAFYDKKVQGLLNEGYPRYARAGGFGEAVRQVMGLWRDQDALQARDQRDLDGDTHTWRERLNQRMAITLGEAGDVYDEYNAGWGWEHPAYTVQAYGYAASMKQKTVLAVTSVFDVREDQWSISDDTDHNSYHTGITGSALLSDGTVRLLRYEADLDEMIRQLQDERPY